MAYLSEIIGRPVTDLDGMAVGKLTDVIVRPWAEFPHPLIEAVAVIGKGGTRISAIYGCGCFTLTGHPIEISVGRCSLI